MGLRARILDVLLWENGGPRKRTVLKGMARTARERDCFKVMLRRMISRGDVVIVGTKKGSRYARPGQVGQLSGGGGS
jgi:hypothetical protein